MKKNCQNQPSAAYPRQNPVLKGTYMASLLPQSTYRTSPLPFATPAGRLTTPPASLLEAVQTAVQRIEDSDLHPMVARSASFAFQPRVVLAILTYCYARKVYGSLKVLAYLSRDAAFRTACRSEFPSPRELQSFRKQNRFAIEKCVTAALHFVARQELLQGFVTRIQETIIAEEAKRRIIMAACVDGMELENESPELLEP
jgi:hypothetical protein